MSLLRFAPALATTLLLTTSVAFAAQTEPSGLGNNGNDRDSALAKTTPGECMAMQERFDQALKAREKYNGATKAKSLRADGGQLCASGKTAEGIKKLDEALNDIGMKGVKSGE